MDSENNFMVGTLNEEESLNLFQKMVGGSTTSYDLRTLAVDIVKECAGLPIAIVTLARALREENLFQWKNALLELRRPSSRNFVGMQAVAYSSIELSYNFLKDQELKSTFLFCSIMGYTYNASILDLLKYGIGMGLLKGINTMEEARDRVCTLIHKLKTSSLLIDSYSSEMFAMHDVIRDVAISIAYRDQHVFAMSNEVVPQEWLDKDTLKICSAISLHKSDINEFPEELKCPQLKFFYMYPKDPRSKIPNNFFAGMMELRVLDLTKMHLLSLPSSLPLLLNLRTLCLDQCILGDLAVIGNLKKLEILSFLGSDIEQLPREIGQLSRLRLLDLSNCSKLKVIPPNVISSLSQLEELYMGNSFVQWEVDGLNIERSNTSLDELKHLSKLTSLEIHIRDAEILPSDLFFKNLVRYKIFIGDEWDWNGKYETSRTLKLKLSTRTCLENGTIMQLKRIEDLYLGELQDVKNVLYVLDREGFPQLKHLHIQNNPYILCIVDSMKYVACGAFPHLESLVLHNLINLEKICHGQLTLESFCNLQTIKLENCNKLKSILSVSIARGLQRLQIIEVTDCKSMEDIFANEREDTNSNEVFLEDNPVKPRIMISEEVMEKLRTHSRSSFKVPQGGRECSMMMKMRVTEGDIAKDEIVFNKLKSLSLSYLPSLTSFCFENYNFKFPSLEAVTVRGCPNMKTFTRGVSSTPRLQEVKLTEGEREGFWDSDMNTTIQEFHKKLNVQSPKEE